MRRSTFLRRMAYAAAGVGLLGIELERRAPDRWGDTPQFAMLAEDMAIAYGDMTAMDALERMTEALDVQDQISYLKMMGAQP